MKIIILAVIVFALSFVILSKLLGKTTLKSRRSLEDISRQFYDGQEQDQSLFIEEEKVGGLDVTIAKLPFVGGFLKKVKASGYKIPFGLYLLIYVVAIVLIGLFLGNLLNKMYYVGFGLAFIIVTIISNMLLGSRISKRESYYLNNFPDAVDMIVRSVKSGQPLLSALKMIAHSASQPLAGDFQRVVDEVSYGRPLPEALKKMADRVGFVDVSFFVVILSVQQDTGGNLSEVLTNLSNIIRKRKQLKLKIKALTAQSKMTTMIFSCIPILQMGAIYAIKPDYLKPFTTTNTGVYALIAGLGCIAIAIFLGRKVSNLEV